MEYQLDGVNQIQVKPKIGLSFTGGLQAASGVAGDKEPAGGWLNDAAKGQANAGVETDGACRAPWSAGLKTGRFGLEGIRLLGPPERSSSSAKA